MFVCHRAPLFNDAPRTDINAIYQTLQVTIGLQFDSKDISPLTPNDNSSGRTAPLTSKRFILYIYSTNISTEYFKHGI